jgi:homogentisate 1,2-dioxygenase
MAFYRQVGEVPPKRHTQFRRPDGGLYSEELMGEEGFSSDSSLLYHVNIPSAVVDVRPWELPDLTMTPNHPLTPRHFSTHALFPDDASADEVDAVTGRRLLMGNGDVRLSYVVATAPSPYYRNAIGDECLYIEAGSAVVETVFGDLAVGEGDYAIVPRATTFRVVPQGPVGIYVIEANSHIGPPKRYLSRFGQLLEHAPYCERDLRGPSGPKVVATDPDDPAASDIEVRIKHRGPGPGGIAGSIHTLPHHPFDVVGWDGCLYPYAFNIADYEPITGRGDPPPAVHQVF